MSRFSVLLLTFSAFSAASGQLLLKVGARGREQLLDFINPPIVFGLVLYATSTVIWIYALSAERLVNVYAFTALTFVLVYLGGVLLIRESLSAAGLVGVLLVLSGLFLITNYNN